jgi:hypothetical protein
MQRRYLFFVKLCFDNIMSIIMKVSYMKSNDINTATNSCSLYMQCIHGIVLLHLFEKKNEYGVNVQEPQSMKYDVIIKQRNSTFIGVLHHKY